jgi:adenosylcobinamide-phosphate synthase
MKIVLVLLVAFTLDVIFGDPRFIPHPICLIGLLITRGEKLLRRIFPKTNSGEFAAGTLLTLLVVAICYTVPYFIIFFANKINFYLGLAIEIIFCYQILAVKSLKIESMRVFYPLKNENLTEARKFLSWIVGRDTANLDAASVTRAAVETVAENTCDAVIAPLIFMVIGGAPLGFLYKAINTLDSMVGYKNEKYLYFGRFAAKLDDAANFIPARVSAFLMIAAAWLLKYDVKNALRIFLRDRKKHASPNSAQTESVCAGALGVQLAGNAYYFGKLHEKQSLGDPLRSIVPEDIIAANRLMIGTATFGVILACIFRILFLFVVRCI